MGRARGAGLGREFSSSFSIGRGFFFSTKISLGAEITKKKRLGEADDFFCKLIYLGSADMLHWICGEGETGSAACACAA